MDHYKHSEKMRMNSSSKTPSNSAKGKNNCDLHIGVESVILFSCFLKLLGLSFFLISFFKRSEHSP